MPIVKKNYKKFNKNKGKKKATGLTKTQLKAVSTIARRAVGKTVETKSYYGSHTSSSIYGSILYAKNLIYSMSQGYNSETYIGEKLWVKNIHIKGLLAFDSATASVRAKLFRLLVVRCTKLLTSGSGSITETEIFRSGSSNLALMPACYHTDSHKVDILYDSGAKTINESFDSNVPIYPFDLNIKINKNLYMDADNSGVFKGGDYYFIWCAEDLSGATAAAKIAFDYTINYKDA